MSVEPKAAVIPDLDPRAISAIDHLKFADCADVLEDFGVIYPPAARWIGEVVPALRAAAEGRVEEAAFLLIYSVEPPPPKAVYARIVAAIARALEEKQPWIAAALFSRVPDDPKMAERASMAARRGGGKPEDIVAKFNEVSVEFQRALAEANPNDPVPHERLGVALIAKPGAARAEAERAIGLDSESKAAWLALAAADRVGIGVAEATNTLNKAATRNPAAAWPWLELARPISDTEFAKALSYADRALAADPMDEVALELRRKMLRKLEKWQELVELLEYMTSVTSDRLHLHDLYDEWARVTSDPLKDPLGAVELQKQADFFKDDAKISEFYWKTLSETGGAKEVWEEVDQFFRYNRMWNDLGRLLLMKVERAFGEERLRYLDELRVVWLMVPGRGDIAWHDAVMSEVDRAGNDADLRKSLEERLVGIDVPPEEKPPAELGPYVLAAAGALVVVLILLVAVAVLPFFMQ